MYDEDFEKPLSFLCDGYNHCADGTDERKDMCYRTKSKVSDLLTCVPMDTRFGINTSVTMWQDRVCDGVPHCVNGQDEAFCLTGIPVRFRMSSSVIIILTCAGTLLIAWIACFAYRIRNKSRASDPFQDQITSRSRIYQHVIARTRQKYVAYKLYPKNPKMGVTTNHFHTIFVT